MGRSRRCWPRSDVCMYVAGVVKCSLPLVQSLPGEFQSPLYAASTCKSSCAAAVNPPPLLCTPDSWSSSAFRCCHFVSQFSLFVKAFPKYLAVCLYAGRCAPFRVYCTCCPYNMCSYNVCIYRGVCVQFSQISVGWLLDVSVPVARAVASSTCSVLCVGDNGGRLSGLNSPWIEVLLYTSTGELEDFKGVLSTFVIA